jgi:CTP synthase (UTP-ammonia lyase)
MGAGQPPGARKVEDDKGGTMRLGAYDAHLADGSLVAQVYGATVIEERHRHRYEVDIAYRDKLEGCGLMFSGMSPDGRLPEIVEHAGPPLVHRRAVPPRTEVEALRAAPAVRRFRARRGRDEPAGLRLSTTPRRRSSLIRIRGGQSVPRSAGSPG